MSNTSDKDIIVKSLETFLFLRLTDIAADGIAVKLGAESAARARARKRRLYLEWKLIKIGKTAAARSHRCGAAAGVVRASALASIGVESLIPHR